VRAVEAEAETQELAVLQEPEAAAQVDNYRAEWVALELQAALT
jgi:hypothetical protein